MNQKLTIKGLLIWLICSIFFLYEFMLRTILGSFQTPIITSLQLTNSQFTILSSSIYVLIYGIMQIPAGIIIDQKGLKFSATIACLLCSIPTLGMGLFTEYNLILFCRALQAIGSAFGFICLIVTVYNWMPNNKIALWIGISQFIGTMGPMLAAGPIINLTTIYNLNWQNLLWYLGIFGILLTILIALLVNNNKVKHHQYIILKPKNSLKSILQSLLRNKTPILIVLYSGMLYFPLEYLSENNGIIFLTMRGYSAEFAGYCFSLAWLGYGIGAPILGYLSDYFQRRKIIMAIGSASNIIGMLLFIGSTQTWQLIIGMLLIGTSIGSLSVCYALMAEQYSKDKLAMAISINNISYNIIMLIASPILTGIINYLPQDNLVIAINSYKIAFTTTIILVVATLLITIFWIKESFCKSQVELTIIHLPS